MPNAMKLEVVLRVALSRSGALVASPELLKAPASVNGPVLVGIAMKAVIAMRALQDAAGREIQRLEGPRPAISCHRHGRTGCWQAAKGLKAAAGRLLAIEIKSIYYF